jgi:hypothetical protein
MKKQKYFLVTLILMSMVLLFVSCKEDVLAPPGINYSVPEVTSIEADQSTILINTAVQVFVVAMDGNTYVWSADEGSFDDASAATTTWTASGTAGAFKLTCTVSNSSGSRKASVTVKVVETLLPEGVIAYWTFDSDFSEEVSGDAGTGGADVSITADAAYGDGAALFEGVEENTESALFYEEANAPMGPEDLFTISLWVKTEDEGLGFLFGRSLEGGEYVEGAKGIYLEEGAVVFDVSWIDAIGSWDSEVLVNDDEWHHIAFVKGEEEMLIYIDGEEVFAGDVFGEWSDDEGTMVTIGAAAEEEGSDWPGIFQGSLDDIRYYETVLSEEEIVAIFEE